MGPLQKKRLQYQPTIPILLQDLQKITFCNGEETKAVDDVEAIQSHFPHTFGRPILHPKREGSKIPVHPLSVGVVFSGGQAAGGHNVIAGIFDALKRHHHESSLYGFLNGPGGLVKGEGRALSEDEIAKYRNQGGFDLIGSGRTKIETEEQLQDALATVKKFALSGLVIIGGDDSNTNAAVLAEYFIHHGCGTRVIGVPKTIDGDLKNAFVELSFGFDTACRTYAEMIGNIARDSCSARKYTHFVKLMGRSASHIALECALQTHPNLTFIGEEVAAKKQTLADITEEITDLIRARGNHYGVIVVPEGLIEFIPEVKHLICDLNDLLAKEDKAAFSALPEEKKIAYITENLASDSRKTFSLLPKEIQLQLCLDRDPHGNVQVSSIQTERLLSTLVKEKLQDSSFYPVHHFFGYEGRSALPSNFDATYCYSLGLLSALLIRDQHTGYMSVIRHLDRTAEEWGICAIPITSLMNMEYRSGKEKPVIRKALVDLKSKSFLHFVAEREKWKKKDSYRYPGPIQFEGDKEITDSRPLSL